MDKVDRIKSIINILKAVNVLRWEDKNFLCTPESLNRMEREFLDELLFLVEKTK
jgi:hypothetical protein